MNLKFKLRKQFTGKYKSNIIKRFIARQTAKNIFNSHHSFYQFAGWDGELKNNYNMCLASKFQLMHWILFNAGYSCSVSNIMDRCGINEKEWEKFEMEKPESEPRKASRS